MSTFSTAGAVPVVNEKGQVTMQKVKVVRYQPGKKPKFANQASSEEEEDDNYEEEIKYVARDRRETANTAATSTRQSRFQQKEEDDEEEEYQHRSDSESEDGHRERHTYQPPARRHGNEPSMDPRLRRLQGTEESIDERLQRRRALLEEADTGIEQVPVGDDDEDQEGGADGAGEGDDDEIEEDEDEAMRRRTRLRELAKVRQTEELMAVEEDQEEDEEEDEEEEEEYEEYEDSEDDMAARLKPVFVRKKDRVTLQEREEMEEEQHEDDEDESRMKDERKQIARRLVEDEVKREIQAEREAAAAAAAAAAGGLPIPAAIANLAAASAAKHPGVEGNFNYGAVQLDKHIDGDNMTLVAMSLEDVVTDDETGEVEYEKWKLRELRRIKRDRDERENMLREREEVEAIHNMTEEERKAYLVANPKVVTNKQDKGKYKFLQKYYHRGVFYLDKDEEVLKRDICEPTLEDRFDRTIMPKVMQVKNFGKKGRTKYTHLVDQDTAGRDTSAWNADAGASQRWHQTHGGGTRQVFDRPGASSSKRKQ